MAKFLEKLGAVAGAVGTALNPIAGMYDSYQQSKTAKRNTDKTIKANREAAELAYRRDLEMWDKQNAYNSPQAQMQRYTDAGLNPHLIYGQGTPGNASSIPNYQPPNYQYNYAATRYGSAVASTLPMIMEIGSWLQNMRQGEANINKTLTETQKAEQVIDYMTQVNPEQVRAAQNKNSLFDYTRDAAKYKVDTLYQALMGTDLEQRFKFGNENVDRFGGIFAHTKPVSLNSGLRGAELQGKLSDNEKKRIEIFIKSQEAKLKEAQASWTEFDITNPQGLMQMALTTALGMAGAGLAIRRPGSKSSTPKTPNSKSRFEKSTNRIKEFLKNKRESKNHSWGLYTR